MKCGTVFILLLQAGIRATFPASRSTSSCLPPHEKGKANRSGTTLSIVRRTWLSHDIVSLVMEIVLKELLGYDVVKVDASLGDTANWGPEMAEGLYSIEMESWSAEETSDSYTRFVAKEKKVVDAGPIGYVGRSGLWTFGNMMEKYKFVDYYKFYIDAQAAVSLGYLTFADSNLADFIGDSFPVCTGYDWCGLGQLEGYWAPPQCESNPMDCLEIIMAFPAYDTGYFEQLTRNLGVKAVHGYYGSGLQQKVESQKAEGISSIFYWWEPHPFLQRVNARRIRFPSRFLGCDAGNTRDPNTGTMGCDYGEKRLKKLVRKQVLDFAPEAFYVLSKFEISRSSLDTLMQTHEDAGDVITSQEVACNYVRTIKDSLVPKCISAPKARPKNGDFVFSKKSLVCEIMTVYPSVASTRSCEGMEEGAADNSAVSIKIVNRSWASHSVLSAIVEYVLKQRLGYSLSFVDASSGNAANWGPEIASGLYDVDIESWHVDKFSRPYEEYVLQSRVVSNPGNIGFAGRSGLWILASAAQAHPFADYYKFFENESEASASGFLTFGESTLASFLGDKFPVCNSTKHSWCGSGEFVGYWVPPKCKANPNACIEVFMVSPGHDTGYFEQLTRNLGVKFIHGYYGERLPSKVIALQNDPRTPVFYWWEPHPFLLKVNARRVAFPEHVFGCYVGGNQDPETGEVSCDYGEKQLEKLVEANLINRAPEAFYFLKSFQILKHQIETMMVGIVEGRGQYSIGEAACNFITNNMDIIKGFAPDCISKPVRNNQTPRDGLVFARDSLTCIRPYCPKHEIISFTRNSFFCRSCSNGLVPNRLQVDCEFCPMGTSVSVNKTICEVCLPGTFSGSRGLSACEVCSTGSMAPKVGSVACDRCAVGTFQRNINATACQSCSLGTTLYMGATNEADCICPRGTFYIDAAGSLAARCLPCSEYMERCDGAMAQPLQRQGYYIEQHADGVLKAYRCSSNVACPGGDFGSCPKGSSGLVCSVCDKGEYHWDGESCAECNFFQKGTFYLFAILVCPLIVGIHWVANDPIRENVASSAAFTMLLGLSMTLFLNLSGFATIDIAWVEPIKTLLFISRFVAADLSIFSLACSLGAGPIADYGAASCSPTVVAIGCILVRLFQVADWRKLVNTFSTFFYGLYLLFVMHALKPLRFVTHPCGEKSVQSIPYMRAGSAEHKVMVGIAIINVIWYCASFLAACAWATWMIGSMAPRERANMLITFRFLFYKFRPERFYWGLVLLVRNAMVAIVPSCWPELPHLQVFVLTSIAAASILTTSLAMPWRVAWINYLDMIMFFVFLLMLLVGAMLIPEDTETLRGLATFVVIAVALILMVLFIAFSKIAMHALVSVFVRDVHTSLRKELLLRDKSWESELGRKFRGMWTNEYDEAVADAFDEISLYSGSVPLCEDAHDLHPALQAMASHKVAVHKINAIAAKIRTRGYSLTRFHDDIIETFPELSLYTDAPKEFDSKGKPLEVHSNHIAARSDSNLSSGRTHSDEYLRTIGAFFAVYWLCRLDIDGREGLAFGVDIDDETVLGVPEDVDPQDLESLSWVKMTASQRRAHFYWTFNWSLLRSLAEIGLALPRTGLDTASRSRIAALLALTAIHDIMKFETLCPVVRGYPYGKYSVGIKICDHDAAIAYVLDRQPDALPSFAALNPEQKRIVRFALSDMNFNAGWLVQAEGPPSSVLGGLKQAIQGSSCSEADVIFYFCHWLTDLAGAEPTPFRGTEKLAAKFPPLVLQSLLECVGAVQTLAGRGEAEVYEEYLTNRWRHAATELGPEPRSIDRIAKLRLHCMAQTSARDVVSAFDDLAEEDRLLLAHELGLTGLHKQSYPDLEEHVPDMDTAEPFLLYYGPAWVQRAGVQDPLLALRILAEAFRAARKAWPHRQDQGFADGAHPVTRIVRVELLRDMEISDLCKIMSRGDSMSETAFKRKRDVFVVDILNDLEGVLRMATDTDEDSNEYFCI